jgi:NAD(P)-dependent dehydrogenase (short-subunit alcohol dehydrogenase family)
VDVSDAVAVTNCTAAIVETIGRIDSLIAVAGVGSDGTSYLDSSEDSLQRVPAVNLQGTFFTLREVVRHIKERAEAGDTGRSLICPSSLPATHGAPGSAAYVDGGDYTL